jgi:hypothetical protein
VCARSIALTPLGLRVLASGSSPSSSAPIPVASPSLSSPSRDPHREASLWPRLLPLLLPRGAQPCRASMPRLFHSPALPQRRSSISMAARPPVLWPRRASWSSPRPAKLPCARPATPLSLAARIPLLAQAPARSLCSCFRGGRNSSSSTRAPSPWCSASSPMARRAPLLSLPAKLPMARISLAKALSSLSHGASRAPPRVVVSELDPKLLCVLSYLPVEVPPSELLPGRPFDRTLSSSLLLHCAQLPQVAECPARPVCVPSSLVATSCLPARPLDSLALIPIASSTLPVGVVRRRVMCAAAPDLCSLVVSV